MASELTEEQRDIIKTFACHSRLRDEQVISSGPGEHDDVRDSLLNSFTSNPTCNLGDLGLFPTEVLLEIVGHMDIQSCFRLRKVNRAAREIVSSVKEYRLIAQHALEFFRAALRTLSASRFTLGSVLELLHQSECHNCGLFGTFVCLGNARRFCLPCLERTPSNFKSLYDSHVSGEGGLYGARPSSTAGMITLSGLASILPVSTASVRRNVPITRTIPGSYFGGKEQKERRLNLIWIQDAIEFAKTVLPPGQLISNLYPWSSPQRSPSWNFMSSTTLPYVRPGYLEAQHGVYCVACQVWLDGMRLSFAPSYYSAACAARREKAYTYESFLQHYEGCDMAKNLPRHERWVVREAARVEARMLKFSDAIDISKPW